MTNKTCTCKVCGKVFSTQKVIATCSALCRIKLKAIYNTSQSPVILEGTKDHDRTKA